MLSTSFLACRLNSKSNSFNFSAKSLSKRSYSDIGLGIFACIGFIISFYFAFMFDNSSAFLEKTFNLLLEIFMYSIYVVMGKMIKI